MIKNIQLRLFIKIKEGEMNIGYITRKDSLTSDLANAYIEALRKHVNK